MIQLIQGDSIKKFSNLVDQMYKLRARIFGERMQWEVNVVNGRERDRFDDLNPLYGLALTPDGKTVIGCFRLLQTTGPNMLADVFPQLLADGVTIRSPLIWESTRFCVDTSFSEDPANRGLNNITGALVSAVFEVGLYAGLSHIVTVVDARMERILRRVGCQMERLGPPKRIGNIYTVAVLMPVTAESVSFLHKQNNIKEFCVPERQWLDLKQAA